MGKKTAQKIRVGVVGATGYAGAELHSSGWLNSFFTNAGAPGGDCNELAATATATRDPIFYMGLKKVNDVTRTWQRVKAADIVVVLDRSTSMVFDCVGTYCDGPPPPSDTDCLINAAKNAALLLADLLEDADGPGGGHRIGVRAPRSAARGEEERGKPSRRALRPSSADRGRSARGRRGRNL